MKTKILQKVLTRLAGRVALIGAVAVMAAALNALPAHANDATCYDISGSGQVLYYGVAGNSGIVGFDDPFQPAAANRGCARDVSGPALQLEGWAWDTNLGWISLYCPGGSGAQNQGIDCGTIPYSVTVSQETGKMMGYAWGENTGWISFSCENEEIGCSVSNLHQVVAEPDPDCIGTIYSTATYPTPPSCPAHTEYDAFAWSDSVGWIDLSGIVIPFPPSLMSINPDFGKVAGGETDTVKGSNFAKTVYYKAVSINNSSGGVLSGYQVSFDLDTAALISAGKMRSDCSDLRVFNTDQSTALPHWIEDGTCNSTTTTVWTKVDVSASATKTIYASYNGLTGTESPEGVFEFFDDFEGPALDTTIWDGAVSQFSVAGGVLSNTGNTNQRLTSVQSFTGDYVLEVKHMTNTGGTPANGYQIGGFWGGTSNAAGYQQHTTADYIRENSTWTSIGAVLPENAWMVAKYIAHGTTVDASVTDLSGGTTYDTRSLSGNGVSGEYVALGRNYDDVDYSQTYDGDWDWVFARKYAATPPVLTLGSETSVSTTVTYGTNSSSSVSRTNNTTLSVLAPASTTGAGAVDLIVTNPDGQKITLVNGYNYVSAPTASLVNPDKGPVGGGQSVTITGTDFYTIYEKPVTISNSGAAISNYQVPFTLDTAALITAGKMAADCSDIRVFDTDGTTNIPFWVVDGTCNTSSTKIWTKVPTVAAAGDTVITVSYGDMRLDNAGDGLKVFEFFDNFGDASLNTDLWVNTSASETGGYAYATTDGEGWKGIIGKQYFPSGYILEHQISFTGDMASQGTGIHGLWQEWTAGQNTTFDEGCVAEKMCVRQTDSGNTEATSSVQNLSAGWTLARINWTDTGSAYYALRSDSWSNSFSLSTYNPTVALRPAYAVQDTVSGTPVQMWVYWTYLRKGVATEPSVVVGAETATKPVVLFDTSAATSVVVVSATSITATTPAHAAGLVNVRVTSPDGQYYVLNGSYTYFSTPTVTVINPGAGPTMGGQSVTITGTNFYGTPTVTLGGSACNNVVVVNTTTITCDTTSHAAGIVSVSVQTLTGTGTLTNGYTYFAGPTVTAINPVAGSTAGGQSVTINGTNFYGTPTVTLGGSACNNVVVVNTTTITCDTTSHAAGIVSVSVQTLTGTGTLTNGYTYWAPPTVTDVDPGFGPIAGGTSVTITGTNFYGTPTVTFGGTACVNIVLVNPTTITCDTPVHADGLVDLVVTTPSGPGTLINGFEYIGTPTVLLLVPSQGSVAGGTSVTITGTNFYGTPTVTFGGTACATIVVVNSTTITCNTPAHASGLVNVVITTNSGFGTLFDGFLYTCAAGQTEQCVEAGITGTITFDVPDAVNFPSIYTTYQDQNQFSYNITGYTTNVNDLLTVYESRNSGGFMVQAHVTEPFDTSGGTFFIPLENFYMATTSSDTGGYRFPTDDGIEYYSAPAIACNGASIDVTPALRSNIPTVLTTSSTFAGQSLGVGQGTSYTTYDLMDCELLSGGRTGIFKQNVNYYLLLKGGQSSGSYNTTITYDLVT